MQVLLGLRHRGRRRCSNAGPGVKTHDNITKFAPGNAPCFSCGDGRVCFPQWFPVGGSFNRPRMLDPSNTLVRWLHLRCVVRTSYVSIRVSGWVLTWVVVLVRNGTRANRALALRTQAYERDKTSVWSEDLIKFLPLWKKDPETVWLGEVSSVVVQQTLRDQGQAFTNFFGSCTGKRKGPTIRPRTTISLRRPLESSLPNLA